MVRSNGVLALGIVSILAALKTPLTWVHNITCSRYFLHSQVNSALTRERGDVVRVRIVAGAVYVQFRQRVSERTARAFYIVGTCLFPQKLAIASTSCR